MQYKNLYTRITGLKYENDEIMRMKLLETKTYLKDVECKILSLKGTMCDIHTSMFITEIVNFNMDDKISYCELFDIKYDNDIDLKIMSYKYRMLEIMRMYSYIDSVLFGGKTSDPEHKFFYYNINNENIRYNNISYYYLRCGECTIETLIEKYNRFELSMICGNLSYISGRTYVLKSSDSNRDIAAMILSTLQMIKPDVRCILTLMGLQAVHNDLDFNISKSDVDESDLLQIYKEKGILTDINDVKMNVIELYHKLVLYQFQKKFYISIPETQSYLIQNNYNLLDEDIDDTNIPIFYGVGDGISTYDFFTEDELTKFFSDNGMFINPRTRTQFNLDIIRTLMLDCQTNMLSSTIRSILPEMKYSLDMSKVECTRTDLMKLFNIGLVLSDWNSLTEINDLDTFIRPTEILYDTVFYKSLRDKIYNVIIEALSLNTKNMFIVDTIRDINIEDFIRFIDTSNSYNSVSERLKLLLECNKLGLFTTITYHGNLLLYTSEFYSQMKFGVSISSSALEFQEAPSIS